jgi:diguanylate cyclase (GGDEF)-like protein/PAS domain S-box-containing protein
MDSPASAGTPSAHGALDFYRSIVDNSDDAIISQGLDGTVLSWNAAAEKLFGWTAAEICGSSQLRLLPHERQAEEADFLARLRAGQRVDHFETERLHKDGHLVDVSVTISPITDAQGRVVAASKIVRDIGERIQAQRTIWLQAHFDPLTQLPNRRLLMDELDAALVKVQRREPAASGELALLFIDLDRFKHINDSLGHAAGDALLVEVSSRIRACVRAADTVARMGGDEFVVLLPSLSNRAEAQAVAARINAALAEPIRLRRDLARLSCSIGYVIHPADGDTASELFAHADMAMYESKRLGRNRTVRFDARLQQAGRRRSRLQTDLHSAAERGELHLEFQPVFTVETGAIAKCEALLRWTHPEFGPVSPVEFIPLAEDSGVITTIGDWVFRTAARQLADWRKINPALQMTVNVSVLQLQAGDGRIAEWPALLESLGLPRQAMVAEITESVMVEGTSATEASLRALRGAGIEVAVDDFGIGFSCLASLDRMDVNCLKIDASFTRKLAPGARVVALCQAITAMAHALGLEVVVEGVETAAQLAQLREIGCDLVQGFLLSRPMRAEALTRLLTNPQLQIAA